MPFLGTAVDDLPAVVRDRVLLPAVDAGPRRLAAEPRPAPAARERELARARHAPTRRCRWAALVFALSLVRAGSRPACPTSRSNPDVARRCGWTPGTFGFSALHGQPDRDPATRPGARSRGSTSRACGKTSSDGVRFLRENSLASSMTLGIVVAFSAVGAVLALGPVFAQNDARRRRIGLGDRGDLVRHRDGRSGWPPRTRSCEFVQREYVFVWSIIAAAAGRCSCSPRCRRDRSAAVIAVMLGAFCGSAWVSGYVLLQENVDRRVPRADVRRAHGALAARPVPVAHGLP